MSDGSWLKISSMFWGLTALLTACASPSAERSGGDSIGTSEAPLDEAGTVTFGADFQVKVAGTLEKGNTLRVAYDANRLTACRGDFNGKPGWSITGFWKIGSGDVHTFEAGGFSPSSGTEPPVLALDQTGDLQIWFQNNSRWGCNAYDSNLGGNYHFTVKPAENEPGWVGNTRYAISRQTRRSGSA